LGWWVVKAFAEAGYSVYATYHSHRPEWSEARWVYLDLADLAAVSDVVKGVGPDVVVHTAAYTDVDGCELRRDYAYAVNYLATRALAKAVGDRAFFVYVSTDYVFDGGRGLYREGDVPNPVNFYGLSKLLGEVAVESAAGRFAVVRVSGLFGASPWGKRNFGFRALESLARGEEVRAFVDQYLSPTYVPWLAERIRLLVERGVVGVVHLAGERLSRFEFALLLAEALGVDRGLVKPARLEEAKLPAKRPRDSSLDTSKAADLGLAMPPTREAVAHFVQSFRYAV